ncbi:MAG: CAP domain-containing protein [Telluria sp.]
MLPTLLLAAAAAANPNDELATLVNAYRAAPSACAGHVAPAPPLAPNAILAGVKLAPGRFLDQAIEDAGLPVDQAQIIEVSGPPDAAGAFAAIQPRYCAILLSEDYAAIGTARRGNDWQIILAAPTAPGLREHPPAWEDAGLAILDAVNAARAQPRDCGDAHYGPAPPLAWNRTLGLAALAHSQDMAAHHYFNHHGRDGSTPGTRTAHAGYQGRRVGENIASGQETPQEAVASWLTSPGHCANIMDPRYTEMGAAYAINVARKHGAIYWTQEFGNLR